MRVQKKEQWRFKSKTIIPDPINAKQVLEEVTPSFGNGSRV